jgi:hypothetical protein
MSFAFLPTQREEFFPGFLFSCGATFNCGMGYRPSSQRFAPAATWGTRQTMNTFDSIGGALCVGRIFSCF